MVEYESTLDLCGSLIVIIFIGFLYGISKFHKAGHVVIVNNIVFMVVIPCHVFTALRKQDWLDSSKEWAFIASFLVLRVFMLLISIFIAIIRRQSIFECISTFLGTCWISTIILGLPLCSSIFGPSYMIYGIYAALSSFFFQLPLMIALFEMQQTLKQMHRSDSDTNPSINIRIATSENDDFHSSFIEEDALNGEKTNTRQVEQAEPQAAKFDCVRITKLVLLAWLKNPIAWAIFWGFLFALIWSAENKDQTPTDADWPTFLDMAMNFNTGLATMTTALGVFVIGLFTAERFTKFWRSEDRSFRISCKRFVCNELPELFLYLFLKFIVCPALMIGIVVMFGFDDKTARIGVIIAVIPTSLASFILAKKYELKTQAVHSLNVIVGTMLMFPFVMMWLKIMDSAELFPDWQMEIAR
eukprot:281255_1